MNVEEYYHHALAQRDYKADEAQQRAITRLQQCYDEWLAYKGQRSSTFKRLINRPAVPKGVYMWGGVGRGKSFLMDSFYSVVPLVRKSACTSTNSCATCTVNWTSCAAWPTRWITDCP